MKIFNLCLLGFGNVARALVPLLDEQRDERSEEHTSELQSRSDLVCRLLLEKKKKKKEPTRHEKHCRLKRDETKIKSRNARHGMPVQLAQPAHQYLCQVISAHILYATHRPSA